METNTTASLAGTPAGASGYLDVFERTAIDAAFLWLLRAQAVEQPHYTGSDLAALERRLDARLDLLMSSLDNGWKVCEAALALQQPGEAFAATVVAMRSHDIGKIQTAIQASLAVPEMLPGVVSALGWLPADIVRPWSERLLRGKDMSHKYLGIAACSVRRDNPGELLDDILQRQDCRSHALLHARALRLAGQIRRLDLMPALQKNLGAQDPAVAFWATWSAILLGQNTLANDLRPYVLKPGPLQARAIQLAFRVLPVAQGREWISALAQDAANARAVIVATGVLGDPQAVNWLIDKMANPVLARVAGEAFTFITGIDLDAQNLELPPTTVPPSGPNDDPDDANVALDDDEKLPIPDPDKVAALWRSHGQHFLVARRYFLGKPLTPEWLKHCIAEGSQRQRHAAALELALLGVGPLINTHARAFL